MSSSVPLLTSAQLAGGAEVGGAQQQEAMFRRRLTALAHFDPEGFNSNDKKKFRATVVWLEDQRVRHLKPEEREALRDTESDQWDEAWSDYLKKVGCDLNVYQNRKNQLMWLTGRATQLYFAERAEDIRAKQEQNGKEESNADEHQNKDAKDPFEGVNVNSVEFKQSVSQLSSRLKIPEHPTDPLVTLHACCLYLSREKERREGDTSQGDRKKRKESVQRVNLDDHGMNIPEELRSNKGLCQAIKILRLFQIQDLRTLQDQVNSTIESAQKLTADPKTDTRLGKVGR